MNERHPLLDWQDRHALGNEALARILGVTIHAVRGWRRVDGKRNPPADWRERVLAWLDKEARELIDFRQ